MRLGKIEKWRSHHGPDRVSANVLSPSVAAAVPIKSRHWVGLSRFQAVRRIRCELQVVDLRYSCRPPTCSVHLASPVRPRRIGVLRKKRSRAARPQYSGTIARPCCFAVSGRGASCAGRSTGPPPGTIADVGEMASVRRIVQKVSQRG